jgi:hypothetical protein
MDSNEFYLLKSEMSSLKNQVDLLKYELFETQSNLNDMIIQFKMIEKTRNQEIKNLRKKVIYLLKRSIEINYDTTDENEDEVEKVIQF